jgi:hypothetical protein
MSKNLNVKQNRDWKIGTADEFPLHRIPSILVSYTVAYGRSATANPAPLQRDENPPVPPF